MYNVGDDSLGEESDTEDLGVGDLLMMVNVSSQTNLNCESLLRFYSYVKVGCEV